MADNTPKRDPQAHTSGAATTPRPTSIPGSIAEEEEDDDENESDVPEPMRQSQASLPPRRDLGRDYGTIETSESGTVRHRAGGSNLGLTSPPLGSPMSNSTPRPIRKPPTRRMSSVRGRQLPTRGEQFSVDDDPDEVEEDRAVTYPTLKRQSSTVRRRPIQPQPTLSRIATRQDNQDDGVEDQSHVEDLQERLEELDTDEDNLGDEHDDLVSEAESFTLKDRQFAINETHPFGIRIWKPALYKKNRSVEKNAEEDIHSSPSQIVSRWLWLINAMWTLIFGWWLALLAFMACLVCFVVGFEPSAREYGKVFYGLAGYLFWPFGKFVQLEGDENYAEEDEGEGRSISEYERWQSGDLEYGRLMFGPAQNTGAGILGRHRNSIDSASERDSLLGRGGRRNSNTENGLSYRQKRRLFGRGQWTLGRVVFFGFFYFFLAPLMLLVSLICWFLVFTIPMGRVLLILFYHLRKRPLALSFHHDVNYVRDTTKPSSILLCTYRAAGWKYWKYTVDGTNIILINFLVVVVFVIVDYYALKQALGLENFLTSPALLFVLALVSIIPLAYFIGQAVASISAQSSMGMGAAVNAFFSTIVEVYLYCIALNEGKGQLVEGSIIGSIFAGILLLPGLSMCFGALKRKTQRYNIKSAGATITMLLFALIATFGPTLFYKIYGSHELICKTCNAMDLDEPRDCRQCYFRQVPALNDDFFVQAVRPYCWVAAVLLFLSYLVGLLFTLRTHAAVIWTQDEEKKPPLVPPTTDISPLDTRLGSISASGLLASTQVNGPHHHRQSPNVRDSQLYRRILGQSLRSAGVHPDVNEETAPLSKDSQTVQVVDQAAKAQLPHLVPPRTPANDEHPAPQLEIPGLSEEQNASFVQHVAELAATAATIAARDVVQHPRSAAYQATHSVRSSSKRPSALHPTTTREDSYVTAQGADLTSAPTAVTAPTGPVGPTGHGAEPGGHDAPNWSRIKSSVVLLTATIAYAIVAEVLVNTVDVVLSSVDIDEKFLGITLFALVPNTTEFLNAISFAMNGNIALSMEIGSAYALQVCLLQIPALVLFSAVHGQFINPGDLEDHTFNLVFPQWDMVTVILSIFLLSHVYGEGKSNYFKGSILVLTYLVVLIGFYFSGFTSVDLMGFDPSDTLAIATSRWAELPNTRAGRGPGSLKKSEL